MSYTNLKAHNPAMVMDLYELTMANGYFHDPDVKNTKVAFDVFFRRVPDGGGFAIFAGLGSPEIHAPGEGDGGVGVSGREGKVRLGAHKGGNIFDGIVGQGDFRP